jgi:integrase
MEKVEPIRKISDIKKIKQILKNKNMRDYLLFVLGINTGLRISDLLKLKYEHIVLRSKIKSNIIIKETKTGKIKQFPITSSANEAIREYLDYINNEYKYTDYIFLNKTTNRPITRVQAYRIINNVARQSGIECQIGTHTLRKTFGYHFYKQYKDVALLQEVFNHSSPSITLRYIGINQDNINKAYRNFSL